MLTKLVKHMDVSIFNNHVISLGGEGLIGNELRQLGYNVYSVGMQPNLISIWKLFKLIYFIRKSNADLVQTWMYHSDLIGGLIAKLCGVKLICWNIRHCNLDIDKNKFSTLIVAKICALLSSILPSRIICNSITGVRIHTCFGYSPKFFHLIPNGFETSKFFPDPEIRRLTRASLGIPESKFVFGNVGRFDKQKNHQDLLSAFALILEDYPSCVLICCGKGVALENKEISDQVEKLNITSNVILLGYRSDTPNLFSAFDAYVSSSLGEGFSNSIGEAMSSAVPCIATDVGDSKAIVGDTGWSVDAGCPVNLAKGMSSAISLSRADLSQKGNMARQRILQSFSMESVVHSFEDFYLKLLS